MQRFKMNESELRQEEEPFEFKPLDLSGFPKGKKKIWVPCRECGVPGCPYEQLVEVDDD